ncbi:MAG TPA: ATP-binding protein [Acidobacteriota bacterium]|nr:ATP-binding protein [Acidobacteriota bacterium]
MAHFVAHLRFSSVNVMKFLSLLRLILSGLVGLWFVWASPQTLLARTGPVPVRLVNAKADLNEFKWKFQPGDDPTWADSRFDDSPWKEISTTESWVKQGHSGYSGYGWYRLKAQLPTEQIPTAPQRALAITLTPPRTSEGEVFIQGRRVGNWGKSPAPLFSLDRLEGPQVFSIPSELIPADGILVIAVRFYWSPQAAQYFPRQGGFQGGRFQLGEPTLLTELAIAYKRNRLINYLPQLLFAAIFVVAGLYHLLLFWRRRQLREYLWFGLILLASAINNLALTPWAEFLLPPFVGNILTNCTLYVVFMGMLPFTLSFLGFRFHRLASITEGLLGLCLVLTLLFPASIVTNPRAALVDLCLLMSVMVWCLGLVIRESWRGNPDARTILFGSIITTAFEVYLLIAPIGVVPFFILQYVGLAVFMFSMAAALANRFNRVYTELDVLNQELEQKVETRTHELAVANGQLETAVEQLRDSETAALKAKAEAERANRAKDIFLANMSHELRTPLNAVLGFAQVMNRTASRPAQDREYLSYITHSGEHLLGLINDVLSIAKIESGRLTLTEQSFDLRELVSSLQDVFRLQVADKGLKLQVEISPSVPALLGGDAGKLRQVLMNLIANAVKFTREGSVTVRIDAQEAGFRFEVADTGIGIAPEDVKKLFQPFSQVGELAGQSQGTGLGLAISQKLVHLMGGELRVTSQPGTGSVFSFWLPLTAAQFETRSLQHQILALAPNQPRWQILVVDDRLENRRVMETLLQTVGFDVQTVATGEQALERYCQNRPDMVFLDLRMPGMDGFEVVRRLRATETDLHSTRLPIIAVTASAFEEDRHMVLASGFDDYLAKPFTEKMLFEMIGKHLKVQFQEEITHVTPSSFDQPSDLTQQNGLDEEWKAAFHRSLTTGRTAKALELIEQLPPHHQSLADTLRRLVKQYRFDELFALLEQEPG